LFGCSYLHNAVDGMMIKQLIITITKHVKENTSLNTIHSKSIKGNTSLNTIHFISIKENTSLNTIHTTKQICRDRYRLTENKNQ
jgi:hypothetical protein